MNYSFEDMVMEAQKRNKDTIMELVRMFQPLLKKFASYLNYDDAYDDLQLGFIEMILSISIPRMKSTDDAFFLSYIKKSVYCNYVKLSKSKNEYNANNIIMSQLTTAQIEMNVEPKTAITDQYLVMEAESLKNILTSVERQVIYQLFYLNNHVGEVAACMKISRQAVNQTKNRALKKLYLDLEGK